MSAPRTTPAEVARLRRALSAALRDPERERAIWLVALKGNPADLHAALLASIRAALGDGAERVIAALPVPGAPAVPVTAGPRRWNVRRLGLATALAVSVSALLVLAPRWLRPAPTADAWYFVLVDRYADGTPDPPGTTDRTDPQGWHGGDLQGVLDHVDDLAALGVGAVWLSPVTDARDAPHGPWGAYHGYWVDDLGAVDPRFGTVDGLRAVRDALADRGIGTYLDVVYNHVGPDTRLLSAHPDWFHHQGDIVDWDDPDQIVTHDVHGLPDLAQEDEAVYAYLRDASVGWIDRIAPAGFRVDAVRHLPEGFLARLGADLRAHAGPGFELVGEVYDGNVDRVAARAHRDHLDAVFDFPLYFAIRDAYCDGGSVGKLAALVGADYGGARPITLVDNHDLPRIRSACHDDLGAVAQALAFQLTARGTPSITWGTEVGLAGAEEPANRADMVFPDALPPIGVTVTELLALRSAWPALRSPETRVVGLSAGLVTFARLGADEVVTVTVARAGDVPEAPPRWTAVDGTPEVSWGGPTPEVRVVDGPG
ncbi:MAG: alpha-amylase family glycosyl hydrolase, partial [Myxococcota bacterium]